MPLINGLDKAKLPDIRRAKGCLEWLYVGDNRTMRSSSRAPVAFSSLGRVGKQGSLNPASPWHTQSSSLRTDSFDYTDISTLQAGRQFSFVPTDHAPIFDFCPSRQSCRTRYIKRQNDCACPRVLVPRPREQECRDVVSLSVRTYKKHAPSWNACFIKQQRV
jgi:hypothetical protein